MQTIVQVIETLWTTQSRGAPAANQRNAVPSMLAVPSFALDMSLVLQHVVYPERDGFRPQASAAVVGLSEEAAMSWRISVLTAEQGVEVRFWGMPMTETSGRAKDTLHLKANTWFQIIGNRRLAEERGWAYRRFVYNIV